MSTYLLVDMIFAISMLKLQMGLPGAYCPALTRELFCLRRTTAEAFQWRRFRWAGGVNPCKHILLVPA